MSVEAEKPLFPADAYARYDQTRTFDARVIADALWLWRLCGRAACRRARACRGNPFDCVPRCACLVPQEARDFLIGVGEAKEEGMPYAQAMEELEEQREALQRWRACVLRSIAPTNLGPGPRASVGQAEQRPRIRHP